MSRLTFCKKSFGENEFNTIRFSGKKSQNFGENLVAFVRQTFLLSVLKKFLREQFLHKKVNSNHFLLLAEKVSNFSSKVPSSAVKTAFNVSGGWNPGKKCFWKYGILQFSPTSRRTFRTVSDKFLAGFWFGHFAYPKGGFGRDSYLECRLYNNGLQAIKLWVYFRKSLVGLSKTNPTCQSDLIWEKHFLKLSSPSLLLDY